MIWRRHRRGLAGACSRSRGRRQCLRQLPVLALLSGVLPAQAANWELEPQFRLSETWTDNYTLAADGADEEEEWITEIAPGLRLSGEGRRADLDLVYRMEHLVHARESDRNTTNHLLNADGGIELVRERLFFTADASRSLESDDGLIGTNSNAIAGDQRDTVTTWSAGPRLQYRFDRFARLEAEYRRQHVDFGSEIDGDSDSDIATLGLDSGPMFTTWGWAVDYSRRDESRARDEDVANDDAFSEDTQLEQLRGELNLRAGAATQLFVAGGTERNEFETADAGDPVDGDFWEAGFRWNPNRRVSLEAAAGERFFGDTARGSLNIRGSALSLELSYAEDVTTTPQLQFERQQVLLTDDEGNLVIGSDGQPVTAVIDVPTVRDDVIIQESARARLRWEHSHTTATLSFIATDREFQREGTSEDTRQADFDVAWSRLTRTTVTAGIGVQDRSFERNQPDEEITTVRAGATRELGSNADLDLEFEHVSRERTYDVNRITLGLDMRF